jgi:phosphate transport system ATP-binding protein
MEDALKERPARREDGAPAAPDAPGEPHAPASRADETDVVLETRGLHVAYGDKEVLRGIDQIAYRHSVLALIGPSGCGKTTLLRSLNRLVELAPTARVSGQVLVDGEDVYGRRTDLNLLRRRVGMVFQQPNPFPMSIFENVAFAIREQARRRPRRSQLEPAVRRALERAGLWDEVKDTLGRNALTLSGGQQQRLCIARAMAADPEVLLMDEPCSALDPRSTAKIEELILALRDEVTVIIVTHNLGQARRVSDHVSMCLDGIVVETGRSEAVFADPTRAETRDYLAGMFG